MDSKEDSMLEISYIHAVAEYDEIYAAEIARKYRNKLLDSSDKIMVSEKKNEAWKIYRQALRDVPEQDGFPLIINWPIKPND